MKINLDMTGCLNIKYFEIVSKKNIKILVGVHFKFVVLRQNKTAVLLKSARERPKKKAPGEGKLAPGRIK